MSERVKAAVAVFVFMTINVLLAIGVSLGVTNHMLFDRYNVGEDGQIPRTGVEISAVDFYDMREDGERESVTGYILTVQNTNEKYLITDMFDPIQMSEEKPSE